jgi:hypothetical protein
LRPDEAAIAGSFPACPTPAEPHPREQPVAAYEVVIQRGRSVDKYERGEQLCEDAVYYTRGKDRE